MLAETLNIDAERALDLYYSTQTARQLSDARYGLQLMSDHYILDFLPFCIIMYLVERMASCVMPMMRRGAFLRPFRGTSVSFVAERSSTSI